MNSQAQDIIDDFLNFNGEKNEADFRKMLQRIAENNIKNPHDHEAIIKLHYVFVRIEHGLREAMINGIIDVFVQDTAEDIEKFFESYLPDLGKVKPIKRKSKKGGLGKLVDHGEVPYTQSRADIYWKNRMKLIFTPTNKELRSGAPVPEGYDYTSLAYLKKFYGLKSIEFGNWLSQQDRKNYLAALGLGLFDLHKTIGFNPVQISLGNNITVAFGARGRGSALAHFEPATYAINITRYKRPARGSTLKAGFDRTKILFASGGVGSFAHEYGHALDFYGGLDLEKTRKSLSDGSSLRVNTDLALLKKNTLAALMERILDKIIWKNKTTHSAYYLRLKSEKNPYHLKKYYFRRAELFARAFEVYIHYKMGKKGYRNIFLAETKYEADVYLTLKEMATLEKDFDALLSAIKRKL